MFTFIKSLSCRLFGNRSIEHTPPATGCQHPRQPEHIDAKPLNPWERELYRLARNRGPNTSDVRSPVEKAPEAKGTSKQGTLTDLKIWWSHAAGSGNPLPMDLKRFAPVPSKRRNRWTKI